VHACGLLVPGGLLGAGPLLNRYCRCQPRCVLMRALLVALVTAVIGDRVEAEDASSGPQIAW
jgi:hypothetical protein